MVGGGIVIDPTSEIFKRTSANRWELLKAAATLDAKALIQYVLTTKVIVVETELLAQSLLSLSQISGCVEQLINDGTVIKRDRYLILKCWDDASDRLMIAVRQFHLQNQHLAAMPLATLAAAAGIPQQLFDLVIEELLSPENWNARMPVSKCEVCGGLSPALELGRNQILAMLRENAQSPISRDEIFAANKEGRKIYAYLKQNGEIIDLGGRFTCGRRSSVLHRKSWNI